LSGIEGTSGSLTGTTHRAEVTNDNKLAVYATGSNGVGVDIINKELIGNSAVDGAGDTYYGIIGSTGKLHTQGFRNAAGNGRRMLVDSDRHGQVDVIASLPAGTNLLGKVKLTNDITDVDVNPAAQALYTSRAQHSRIVKSLEFCGCHRYLAVADNASVYLLGKVGADKNAHGDFRVSSEGKVYIELYEAPTITLDGTAETILSVNRQTLGTPTATLWHTPTIAADGTQLNCSMLGTAGRKEGAGGISAAGCYFLFKKSTNYLLKVTNKKGAAADINMSYSWHEE